MNPTRFYRGLSVGFVAAAAAMSLAARCAYLGSLRPSPSAAALSRYTDPSVVNYDEAKLRKIFW